MPVFCRAKPFSDNEICGHRKKMLTLNLVIYIRRKRMSDVTKDDDKTKELDKTTAQHTDIDNIDSTESDGRDAAATDGVADD